MTFDSRWGCFENMPTNLVGPSPTPMPTFSSVSLSMVKRITGHTYRLYYFSTGSIEVNVCLKFAASKWECYRHTWESSASFDTFCSKVNIHIFHLEWIFCWNLLCLYDTELPNLETCAHTDIKILCNKLRHWLQIGQVMVPHSRDVLHVKRIMFFLSIRKKFWRQTCESLNVNVTPHTNLVSQVPAPVVTIIGTSVRAYIKLKGHVQV